VKNVTRRAHLPERLSASLPRDDPRFDPLLAELEEAMQRGRGSPVPRMLGEYALIGYLFMHGKLGTVSGEAPELEELYVTDRVEQAQQREEIAHAADVFDFT